MLADLSLIALGPLALACAATLVGRPAIAPRFAPLFARVTRNLGPRTRIDLYAGVCVLGRLSVDDANSNGFAQDDYKTAPAIGITLAHRY